MKVGDLVMFKDSTNAFMSGVESGTGIVIQVDQYENCDTGLSICVQWTDDYLWYEEKDLEVINESR
jgi:hypothetical protein